MHPVTVEHAKIHVTDLDAARALYGGVMGLVEINRDGDTSYYGCGIDANVDLIIEPGGTGLEHIAFRVGGDDAFERFKREIESAGIDLVSTDDAVPGVDRSLAVRTPSKIKVELLTVEDPGYAHADDPVYPSRGDAAPIDFDHINIRSPVLHEDVAFLTDHLGLQVSEIIGDEEHWIRAFLRCNEEHHDMAMGPHEVEGDETASLHHIAFKYHSIDHMLRGIDRLAEGDVAVEHGLGRHYAGNNLYTYHLTPGGNRMELIAEMGLIYTDETNYMSPEIDFGVAWGAQPPESFSETFGIAGFP